MTRISTKPFTGLFKRYRSSLSHLLFPQLCVSCSSELSSNDNQICSFCSSELELTNYHLYEEPTDMDKLFWGRVEITSTYAHLEFKKNSSSQKILFNLKYKDGKSIGLYFGGEIGKVLLSTSEWREVDALLPVPLHRKKEFIRGYNQSKLIAEGISSTLNITVRNDIVNRSKHTETQTGKSRFERWENVSRKFVVHPDINKYSHVAIVDDVITTGATTEAIIQSLRKEHPTLQISVITLAIA